MKRVLLLGATGMLGSAVYDVLKDRYRLILGVRNPSKLELLERQYGGTRAHETFLFDAADLYQDYTAGRDQAAGNGHSLWALAGEVDYVINAIGMTIPFSRRDPALTFFVNGALPHLLARVFGERLIHVTTDCVYDGKSGFPYSETSPQSPVDIYGISKSLGEPADCLTIRTSIVGRELDGHTGLLDWFLQQQGKEIVGFAEHYWNGITTHQFGELCRRIIDAREPFPRRGLFHVYSTPVSKYDILLAFRQKYGVKCSIRPDHTYKLNRTLATVRELNSRLNIPSFREMIQALPN